MKKNSWRGRENHARSNRRQIYNPRPYQIRNHWSHAERIIYSRLSRHLREHGYHRSMEECRSKVKSYCKAFYDALETWRGIPPQWARPERFAEMWELWEAAGRPHWQDFASLQGLQRRRMAQPEEAKEEQEQEGVPEVAEVVDITEKGEEEEVREVPPATGQDGTPSVQEIDARLHHVERMVGVIAAHLGLQFEEEEQ